MAFRSDSHKPDGLFSNPLRLTGKCLNQRLASRGIAGYLSNEKATPKIALSSGRLQHSNNLELQRYCLETAKSGLLNVNDNKAVTVYLAIFFVSQKIALS